MIKYRLIYIPLFVFILLSCNSVEVPVEEKIELKLIDVSASKVYLNIQLIGLKKGLIKILKDESFEIEFHMFSNDTCIVINDLVPNKQYVFKAILNDFYLTGNVGEIEVTTMRLTTNNIFWQKIDFSWIGRLDDVSIVSEDDIWAVGYFTVEDSTGTEQFNGIHWDGIEWEFQKIPAKIWNTNTFSTAHLDAIFATSVNQIWVTTGGQLIHYNGSDWGEWKFLFESLEDTVGNLLRLWVSDNNTVWGVGRKGRIVKYSNSVLTEFESGTNSNITDIWGSKSEITGKLIIYCTVPTDNQLIVINEQEEIEALDISNTIPNAIRSIWSNKVQPVFGCGFELYKYFSSDWNQEVYSGNLQLLEIRGSGLNNIFAVGYNKLVHYDGAEWSINESLLSPDSRIFMIAIKDNTIAFVGTNGLNPLLYFGYQ